MTVEIALARIRQGLSGFTIKSSTWFAIEGLGPFTSLARSLSLNFFVKILVVTVLIASHVLSHQTVIV